MTEPETTPRATARAHDAAVRAATETLLNCYMREGGTWEAVSASAAPGLAQPGDTHVAVLPLRDPAATLLVGVRHLSATQRHRFRLPAMVAVGGGEPVAASLDAVAAMLVHELADAADRGAGAADPGELLARMRASVDAVGAFLELRDGEIDALWSADATSFIAGEQALLLGHMLHPTPKSRSEMSDEELLAYAPEAGARFALRWLAVAPGLVEHDSATGTPAPELAERLLRDDPAVDQAALDAALAGVGERVLLPVHPWELAHLREHDAVVAALLQDGALVDLGPLGSAVAPTTSVRTVHNPDWPWQLKFSLHVRVTNSQRVTLPKELRRAVEAARLLQTQIGARAATIAPGFVMLQDPAYLAVRHGGELIDGLSVLLRDNRWRSGSQVDVSALTTLCQDHPYGERSRLGQIVAALAQRTGRSEPDVARDWFARYCEVVLVPLVRLFGELGLRMEPHQQNVLLELEESWPARAVYRDSQGYFHRAAAHEDIAAIVPGIGERSESIFPEALADERLVYYPLLNNALGVVNALGIAGCIDERILLGDLRALLERERARRPLPGDAAGPAARRRDVAVQGEPQDAPARHGRADRRHRDAVGLRADRQPAARGVGMTPIALRPLDLASDVELVHGWMQEPHVEPWWELAGSVERVLAYLRARLELAHLDCWIACEDGRPFAYVETYEALADPLGAHYAARPGDRGFHLLVGPPELLGGGAARRLARHLLATLLAQPQVTRVVCEPDARNARMLAFCRALGGAQIATFHFEGRRVALIAWTEQLQVAAA